MSKGDNAGKMKGLFADLKAVKQGGSNGGVVSETKQDEVPAKVPEEGGDRKPREKTGKRNSPDHTQVSAYIPVETNLKIKMALSQEAMRLGKRKPREFSQLVADLLNDWLANQPPE